MCVAELKYYQVIDGIKCYAPELAYENEDYPTGHFDKLFSLETKHFWFKARNRIIKYLFFKYLGEKDVKKILEIGCGTGFILSELSKSKNYELAGAELYIEGLKFAKRRLPNVEFVQLDARDMPFNKEFDAVGAFDVLEHIEEDVLIMESVYKSLSAGGYFFITVPQHKWLWSTQDDTAFHKRRYSRDEIVKKLQDVGFSIQYISSFVFFLLPLMILSRSRRKGEVNENTEYSYDEIKINPLINFVLDLVMRLDELLIKLGVSIPLGGSMIVVAKKC